MSLHGAENVAATFHTEEIPPSVLVELLETLLIFPSNSLPDIVAVTRLLDVITGTKRYDYFGFSRIILGIVLWYSFFFFHLDLN